MTRAPRVTLVALAVLAASGCGGREPPASADAPMRTAAMPMEHMDMRSATAESAAIMRRGFCAADPASPAGTMDGAPRVVLVVGEAAAARAMRLPIAVERSGASARPGVAARLTADDGTRAACAGAGLMFGGMALYDGTPVLRIVSERPVTVVARRAGGDTLAGPLEIAPGGADTALTWGGRPPA
jgi:hypothetical protein